MNTTARTSVILGLDVETYSQVSLKRVGAESYAAHPSTGVHCAVMRFATSKSTDTKRIVWTAGSRLPSAIVLHVASGQPVLAHNASFEAAIIRHILHKKHGWPTVPTDSWRDSMACAAAVGLPTKLEGLAKLCGGKEQKDMEGNALMREFATRSELTPEELARLIDYCDQDVLTMIECFRRTPRSAPAFEAAVQRVDRRVNSRGVCLDLSLVDAIGNLARMRREQLDDQTIDLTGGEMVTLTSAPSLKDWLGENGIELPLARRVRDDGKVEHTPTIDRATVEKLAEDDGLPPHVRRVLQTRVELGRATSLAKLKRVAEMVSEDHRLRQAFRYCGAHTGRWSSEGLQLHNLPRSPKEFAKIADKLRAAVLDTDLDTAMELAPNLLQSLSWLLRSVVCAAPGHDLVGGDFSAIEARVIAWLAGQDDVLQMFADGDRFSPAERVTRGLDVYTEDARRVGSDNRQLGKMQRLALGYGMGIATCQKQSLKQFGLALDLKTTARVQKTWRAANEAIVGFWSDLEDTFKAAMRSPGTVFKVGKHLTIRATKDCVLLVLPSGRALHYWRPYSVMHERKFEVYDEAAEKLVTKVVTVPELRFHTVSKDRIHMTWEGTYGGKLAENVTQAVSRDLLGASMIRLDATPTYPVVAHVHDSILSEVRHGRGSTEEHSRIMATVPAWAPGLPIAVDGYRAQHFRG